MDNELRRALRFLSGQDIEARSTARVNKDFESISSDDFAWLEEPPFPDITDIDWRARYNAYMKSPRWRRKRAIAIYQANNRCSRCKWQSIDGAGLEVHHKTYEHLGNEPLEDLEVLCKPCHEIADREREAETRARQHQRLEEARFEGWADKVDPGGYEDRDRLYDRYEQWRERHEDDY
jgi:hypothetical protein